jgi:hypothetical protein
MEIKDLLREIEVLETNIRSTDNLLELTEKHGLHLMSPLLTTPHTEA